jgi:hypothetical protein
MLDALKSSSSSSSSSTGAGVPQHFGHAKLLPLTLSLPLR